MNDVIAMHRRDLVAAVQEAVAPLVAENKALAADLAKEKGGWDAFYKLRRSVGEDRYPGMTGEVTAPETGVEPK